MGLSVQHCAGGANRSLSNLENVAINAALVPDANDLYDFGKDDLRWKDGYFSGTLTVWDLIVESGSSIHLAGATFENKGHYTSIDTNWMVEHDDQDTAFIGVYANSEGVMTHANLVLDAQGSALNLLKNSPSHPWAPSMSGIVNEGGNYGVFVNHDSEISWQHFTSLTKDVYGNITNMTGMQSLMRLTDDHLILEDVELVIQGNLISKQSDGMYVGRTRISEIPWKVDDSNAWQIWTAKGINPGGGKRWRSVAMSGDARIQLAVGNEGQQIYVSHNYGATWTAYNETENYMGCACSADGKYMTVGVIYGNIRTSSDYGVTWTQTSSPTPSWAAIAMDATGKYQVATCGGDGSAGDLYLSNDYGVTWVAQGLGNSHRNGVAMSSDGKYIAVTDSSAQDILRSTDYGKTWVYSGPGVGRLWQNISMSVDGKYVLITSAADGRVRVSADYGDSWFTATGCPNAYWGGCAMSANGKYMIVGVYSGSPEEVYMSDDYGDNFSAVTGTWGQWADFAMSADGIYRLGASDIYDLFTSSDVDVSLHGLVQTEKLSVNSEAPIYKHLHGISLTHDEEAVFELFHINSPTKSAFFKYDSDEDLFSFNTGMYIDGEVWVGQLNTSMLVVGNIDCSDYLETPIIRNADGDTVTIQDHLDLGAKQIDCGALSCSMITTSDIDCTDFLETPVLKYPDTGLITVQNNLDIEGTLDATSVKVNSVDVLTSESDPVFSAWDKSEGISITESQISDLQNYLTSETDPIFSAWDKSIGIVITESQISDLDHFTTEDETDPVFNASPSYNITAQDLLNWAEAYGWEDHAQVGYLTSETDPIFSAWNKSTGISIITSQVSDHSYHVADLLGMTNERVPFGSSLGNGLNESADFTYDGNLNIGNGGIFLDRTGNESFISFSKDGVGQGQIRGGGGKIYIGDPSGSPVFLTIDTATGITSLDSVDTPEIYNSSGLFKIQPDVQGDVELFGDTNVDNAENSKIFKIWRKAAEGNDYIRFYISSTRNAYIHASNVLTLQAQNPFIINSITKDITFRVGDNAGAKKSYFKDSDNVTVASIDSEGWLWIDANMGGGWEVNRGSQNNIQTYMDWQYTDIRYSGDKDYNRIGTWIDKPFQIVTNSIDRITISNTGLVEITNGLNVGADLDVNGDITLIGTVDGYDISGLQGVLDAKAPEYSPTLTGEVNMPHGLWDTTGILVGDGTDRRHELQIESISPVIAMKDTDASSDTGVWHFHLTGDGTFEIDTKSDLHSAGYTAMRITRVTTTPQVVSFPEGAFCIGTHTPSGKLTVDQSGLSAGVPVLTLDQADVSEPWIEFLGGTVATGKNGQDEYIEVKVGGNTRYLRLFN